MAEDYVRDFSRRFPDKQIELVNLDTREGAELAKVYGVLSYPAIVAIANDGRVLSLWQDELLPLMDEVVAYAI